jgi:hypothetical protein
MRLVCSVGRIDQQRLRTGRLTEDDWPRLTSAIQKMQDANLFIDETPALNPLELRARARRLARQYGKLGPGDGRLPAADVRHRLERREPRHRGRRDLALAEGARQGAATCR